MAPFRIAYRTKQHSIGFLGECDHLGAQRHAMSGERRTTDQFFRQFESKPLGLTEPAHDPDDLTHDFGADPVAGKNE